MTFTPEDGEKSRLRYCLELMEGRPAGDGVPYEQVQELLGCDRFTAQQAMAAAKQRLERDGKRSFATKEKYGWVMLRADGHISESDRYWDRQTRVARRRVDVLGGANNLRDELSQDARRELDWKSAHAHSSLEMTSRRKPSAAELVEWDRKSPPMVGGA